MKRYQNNPFFVAVDGLRLLFNLATGVAILFTVLSLLSMYSGSNQQLQTVEQQYQNSSYSPNTSVQKQYIDNLRSHYYFIRNFVHNLDGTMLALLIGAGVLFLAVAIFIGVMLRGISDYTASELAKGKPVAINDAILVVLRNFWGYLWLQIVIGVKIFLWSLLFIIPGIIMAVRYTLSGVSYFSNDMGANAATKKSAELTKGAWLTTYASHFLFNLVTFGLITSVLTPGTNAVLYSQYSTAKKKPKAHMLSWLSLLVPIGIIVLTIITALMIMAQHR